VKAATGLETNHRAEGNAQIIVRAVVEINFIAYVKAQADRSKMALQAAAGIKNSVHVTGAQSVDATEKSPESGGSAIDTEIDEATFECDEGLDAVVADVHSLSKFSVENAQIRA
jgi:hypothetical protein